MPADDKTSRTSNAGKTTSTPANTANPERDKALGLVLNQIERNFGKGSIMRLGDASRMRIETSPPAPSPSTSPSAEIGRAHV